MARLWLPDRHQIAHDRLLDAVSWTDAEVVGMKSLWLPMQLLRHSSPVLFLWSKCCMEEGVLVRRCLMYYYGDEKEIDLDGHGEREFSDWCWMPLEELPEEVPCLCMPLTLLHLPYRYAFAAPRLRPDPFANNWPWKSPSLIWLEVFIHSYACKLLPVLTPASVQVVEFKREVYRKVAQQFGPIIRRRRGQEQMSWWGGKWHCEALSLQAASLQSQCECSSRRPPCEEELRRSLAQLSVECKAGPSMAAGCAKPAVQHTERQLTGLGTAALAMEGICAISPHIAYMSEVVRLQILHRIGPETYCLCIAIRSCIMIHCAPSPLNVAALQSNKAFYSNSRHSGKASDLWNADQGYCPSGLVQTVQHKLLQNGSECMWIWATSWAQICLA